MIRLSFMSRVRLLGENVELRKKNNKLEIELGKVHLKHEEEMADLEKKLEKKYKNMQRRNEILSEDNRRLACMVRNYEKCEKYEKIKEGIKEVIK